MPPKYGSTDMCPVCGKGVGHAEKKEAIGQIWHQTCFKCNACGKVLHGPFKDNAGVPYCENCHSKMYGPKGFGANMSVQDTGSYAAQDRTHGSPDGGHASLNAVGAGGAPVKPHGSAPPTAGEPAASWSAKASSPRSGSPRSGSPKAGSPRSGSPR